MSGFISGLFILFHWSLRVCIYVYKPYCLGYYNFAVYNFFRSIFISRIVIAPGLFERILKITFGYLGSFVALYKFEIICSSSVDNAVGIF